MRIEEDEERKKKKRKKLKRMIEHRDLPRRGQSKEKRWEVWEELRAEWRAKRWDGGMRLGVRELIIFMGIFVITIGPTVIKAKRVCAFWFMDLLQSINFARFGLLFCLSPKRNFFQKVTFWAQPNAFFSQLFGLCAFWAPKSANKRTLNLKISVTIKGVSLSLCTIANQDCPIFFFFFW